MSHYDQWRRQSPPRLDDADWPKPCPYCKTPVEEDPSGVNGITPVDVEAKGCEFCNPMTACPECSKAGGADRVVYHNPPACPPPEDEREHLP